MVTVLRVGLVQYGKYMILKWPEDTGHVTNQSLVPVSASTQVYIQTAAITPAKTMDMTRGRWVIAAITPARTMGINTALLEIVIMIRLPHQPVRITATAVEPHTSPVTPAMDKRAAHLTVQVVDT